jgi:hypothetical protein
LPSHYRAHRRLLGLLLRGTGIFVLCLIAAAPPALPAAAEAQSPPGSPAPAIRLHASPLSDFYFTLRTDTGVDSASNLPPSTRIAATRLHALTEFLPDSIPLKTTANTILLVHRKNPKYTAAINRLLWRRLDPDLGALASPEDLSRVLPEITLSLEPICGNAADSIQGALSDLYKSSYPLYLTSTWPPHHREVSTWIREFERLFLPHEEAALTDISKQLALPLADSTQVRFLVVASDARRDENLYESRDRSYVSIVIPARETGYRAAGRILHWYVRGSTVLSPDSSATALRLLERELRVAKVEPDLMRDLSDALIDYAVFRTLARIYDNTDFAGGTSEARPYMPALKEAWDSRIAGATSIEDACKAIAAACVHLPKKP